MCHATANDICKECALWPTTCAFVCSKDIYLALIWPKAQRSCDIICQWLDEFLNFFIVLCAVNRFHVLILQWAMHSLWCFCPWTFFLNNGLDDIQWISFIFKLHTKFGIISRRVPGLAIGSPGGIWVHGWIICLLYDGLHFGLCF